MPAPVCALPQQGLQLLGRLARALRQIGGNRIGGGIQRCEAIRMRGHETQNALHTRGIPARRDVDQHDRAKQAWPARLGKQAEQAAHRCGNQHRRLGLLACQHDQVIGELRGRVGQVCVVETGIAMTAGIVGQRPVAGVGQSCRSAFPCMSGLSKPVRQQHRRRVVRAPHRHRKRCLASVDARGGRTMGEARRRGDHTS